MTHDPIVSDGGPCPDGCGHLMRVHGTDASHMGFALVLLKARWASDNHTTLAVTAAIAVDELLRSGIEMALSLTMSASAGLSGIDDIAAGRLIDRETAALWLESMSNEYTAHDRGCAARLCHDLSKVLTTDGPVDDLDLHTVDLATVMDVCAGIIQMTEERRNVSAAKQFAAYEYILAFATQDA